MQITEVIDFLKVAFSKPLPGFEAQLKMAPVTRMPDGFMPDATKARKGSVLIYIYPGTENQTSVLLMKRPEYKGVHSGQISFPGGKQDKTDKDFIETALREFKEETGILQQRKNVIGTLSELYIPASNFYVYPVVSFAHERQTPKPDPTEVEYLIEVPLKEFLDERNKIKKKITTSEGYVLDAPCFFIQDEIIWGATAMVLSEFVELIAPMKK